ncbi:endolytic transglycosylase MltG [Aeromicrobium sp. CTD01-1L150]|uniref:endolytic transglycosylase MltG n=1 Tax=Aeromicrobium sp. CTD01-1L150 TaxID=3341830 RepID=UPI0035C1CC29
MSDSGLDIVGERPPERPRPGRRRAAKRKRRGRSVLRLIVILAVLAGLVAGGLWAVGKIDEVFNGPDDYTGQGEGEVVVEITEGSGGQQIAEALAEADVVASAEAFYQLALVDERINEVQPGFYQLRSKMSAEWAMRELADPNNRVEGRVTIPEGARVNQIPELVANGSQIAAEDVEAELEEPGELGLPEEADGNPEGYLFPATYTVQPGASARELLQQMVARMLQVESELTMDERSRELGYDKEEILTIASILEYEVATDDFARASRVIHNRLEAGEALRMDSTVHYISGRAGDVFTTPEERESDSPYNTYQVTGLPPGPIGSPGQAAIEAALNPEEGDWMYFVADPETGETTFNTTYAEHQAACQEAGFSC